MADCKRELHGLLQEEVRQLMGPLSRLRVSASLSRRDTRGYCRNELVLTAYLF